MMGKPKTYVNRFASSGVDISSSRHMEEYLLAPRNRSLTTMQFIGHYFDIS